MKQRAFTLIELLVVIAITAILAALLFPAVSGMIARANAVKFSSNLRTVAAALLSVAADNNATLPAYVDGRLPLKHWQHRVAPYLGEDPTSAIYDSVEETRKSVLHDPADKFVVPQRNVAINGQATYVLPNSQTVPTQGATDRILASIERPSLLMLVGQGVGAQYSTIWGGCARFGFDANLSHSDRYKEGMYFAFVDGHVALKSKAWVQYEYDRVWNAQTGSAFFDWGACNPPPLQNPNP
jgi:prepilin-type N-terminal cleavage/methylation domain-containing protein/prepilin-type processing-associated H-X9-DG protein